ncbi:MAG: hypothetical protein PHS36_08445 [Candidatus Cloacimonetes bacterium]|nr:hypothetical protein [Candidatus Cloacimonadota bacterium]
MKDQLINWLDLSDKELEKLLGTQVSFCLYGKQDDDPDPDPDPDPPIKK